jgi:DNA polymerase I-like protein with 3'-5' exonuclease and polymerase domains
MEKGLPIRSIIKAPPGKILLSFDLSQAEAWVVAYLADEKTMKAVLNTGIIHELSARVIFEMEIPFDLSDSEAIKLGVSKDQRYLGKKMNHSCNYRTGPYMIAVTINKESDKAPYVTVTVRQTKIYHKRWTSFFNLEVWWKEIENKLAIDRTLITPYRRKRTFLDQWGDSLFKEATAYVPQSTVADHMFGAVQPEIGIGGGLLGIQRKIIRESKDILMINTSHDSCLLEVPIGLEDEIIGAVKEQLSRPIMINGETFTIPVDCEKGERWGSLEKVA